MYCLSSDLRSFEDKRVYLLLNKVLDKPFQVQVIKLSGSDLVFFYIFYGRKIMAQMIYCKFCYSHRFMVGPTSNPQRLSHRG